MLGRGACLVLLLLALAVGDVRSDIGPPTSGSLTTPRHPEASHPLVSTTVRTVDDSYLTSATEGKILSDNTLSFRLPPLVNATTSFIKSRKSSALSHTTLRTTHPGTRRECDKRYMHINIRGILVPLLYSRHSHTS